MSVRIAVSALLLLLPTAVAGQAPPPDQQIAAALLAAPDEKRASATVLGYQADGRVVELRKGSGDLVCLADNPADDTFSVACYHESMEPYMARGRALRDEGVNDGGERNRIRWEEADAGTLRMPEQPASMYIRYGGAFDPASGTAEGSKIRWVVYTPWATPESTGLSAQPVEGGPWLMFPGTAGSHIMIVPPS